MEFTDTYTYYKGLVDGYISSEAAALKSLSPRLVNAVKYTLLNGGKRLRPVMFLAAYTLSSRVLHNGITNDGTVDGTINDKNLNSKNLNDCAKNLCFSIEALHTYTLIHDDLPCMDDDSVRRGKPANHIEFGQAHALLAGDALLNLSFEHALKALSLNPKILHGLQYFFGETGMGGIVGGQAREFEVADADKNECGALNISEHKTAKLFKAAMVLGGAAGGASKETIEQLEAFGHNFGMAFQLYDDIADLNDEGFAKSFGVERASALKNKYLDEANTAAKKLGYEFFIKLTETLTK